MAGRPGKGQRATYSRGQQLEAPKLSRRELADLSGVSASNIQAIEGGAVTEPGFFTVVTLAWALELDISRAARSLNEPLVFVDVRTGLDWP
jgi:transcriptional regulator with XRE-family HTH domain